MKNLCINNDMDDQICQELSLDDHDLDHAKDHLMGVVEALYYEGNIEKLERCLEEVCAVLRVYFPPTKKIQVQKIKNEYFELGVNLSKLNREMVSSFSKLNRSLQKEIN